MKEILKKIKNSNKVAVIAHISPDADCMSSMTALCCILEQFGKKTQKFVDVEKARDFISFYNVTIEDLNKELMPDEFDLIITVDVPSLRQLGKYGQVVLNFDNVISIDHHISRDLSVDCKYVDSNKSSCSEIIYELAKEMNAEITPEIAGYIFAGIIGDTNCFENDNINENTFRVAAECIKYGADKNRIVYVFKKHQSKEEFALKKIGYENMVIKDNIGYIIFTSKMFKETGATDYPYFVTELLNLEDNKFAFAIKQKEKNTYTVSIRCKEGYNVAKIAQVFGGGGHIQAAGFAFTGAPVRHAKLICQECLKQIKDKYV